MTPQEYLEAIRSQVVRTKRITAEQRDTLTAIDIVLQDVSDAGPDHILGRTCMPPIGPIVIYTKIHRHDQKKMAFTLIHEMGHVITPNCDHCQEWANNCAKLGIEVLPHKTSMLVVTACNYDKAMAYTWLDKKLEHFIDELPMVEW